MIDTHSHILPGVDDGARDFNESIDIIRGLAREGFTSIIATPHYINGTNYIANRKNNAKLLRNLQKKVSDLGVKLYLGNEIYIDEKILELVENGEIASISKSKYLLIELPLSGEYPNMRDILLDLLQRGYKVVLAHPERYSSFQKDFNLILELCDLGILMQCNLGSILGRYGQRAQKVLKKMLKEDLVFMFGSDSHRKPSEGYFTRAVQKIAKYYDKDKLNELLVDNPASMLG